MRQVITILFCVMFGLLKAQTIKRNFYFGNDKDKGLEKVVEVLKSDTNVFHGQYLHFFQNGSVRIDGLYLNNKPTGLWSYYYESGTLKQLFDYKNDSICKSKYFYENGIVKKEGVLKNQMKDSIWTYFYENGAILKKGEYEEDLQNKQWNYFFEDGQSKAVAIYNMGSGNYTEYFYKGGVKMRGPVVENETNGIWNYYYESGKIKASGFEKNGLKNGQWTYYYDNDTIASKGNYVNGTKQGEWKFYHKNGELSSEGLMNSGLRDGYWKLFNEKGGFKADIQLINGTGTYREYYHNNKLKVTGQLKSDKNDGKWEYFYEDGTKEGEAYFVDGLGNYTEFYQSGEMKMKGFIKDGQQVGTWELFDKDSTVIGYYKLIPITEDGEMVQQQLPSTDNNPPVLPNDTVSSHKMPHFVVKHHSTFAPFRPRYGESRGIILSANPIAIVANQIPISIEYFLQERLGHELRYTIRRMPFTLPERRISDSLLYSRGFSLDYKQKYYSKFTKERGMLYFGQEIRFTQDKFYVKSNDEQVLNKLNEKKIEYALTVGDRVMHDIRYGGVTFDIYIGLGAALVFQKWEVTEGVKHKFLAYESGKFEINPRGGFCLGYLF